MTIAPLITPIVTPSTAMLSLRFFGAMSGSSALDHTNAYFMPDGETLVLVDISLVHMGKVWRLLEALKNQLKSVCLCVTHTHLDHVSGITHLAYLVRFYFPKTRLMIYTEGAIGTATRKILTETGAGKKFPESSMGIYEFGNAYGAHRPSWLGEVIRTEHAKELPSGAVGFEFCLSPKGEEPRTLIYSGDTAILEPFVEQVRKHEKDEHLELYLDVSTLPKESHLNWDAKVAQELSALLDEYPNLAVGLMHYDDWLALKGEVSKLKRSRLIVIQSV